MVYGPLCLGNHVDHLHVAAALREVAAGRPMVWWRDAPYVLRDPGTRPPHARNITDTLERKVAACCAYVTQVPTQFGSNDEVRRKLTELATEEARGTKYHYAERFAEGDAPERY